MEKTSAFFAGVIMTLLIIGTGYFIYRQKLSLVPAIQPNQQSQRTNANVYVMLENQGWSKTSTFSVKYSLNGKTYVSTVPFDDCKPACLGTIPHKTDTYNLPGNDIRISVISPKGVAVEKTFKREGKVIYISVSFITDGQVRIYSSPTSPGYD